MRFLVVPTVVYNARFVQFVMVNYPIFSKKLDFLKLPICYILRIIVKNKKKTHFRKMELRLNQQQAVISMRKQKKKVVLIKATLVLFS